jgi:solute carrier family 25 (mitochondrial carrier protein), member 16
VQIYTLFGLLQPTDTRWHVLGMTSVLFTYPLDLIRVRMAYHTRSTRQGQLSKTNFLRAASEIYCESSKEVSSTSASSSSTATALFRRFPILKFYRGFSVTLTGMIPYAGTSFLTWGYLRSHFVPPSPEGKRRATPVADLVIGAVSGMVAQTTSYPFEVIRRRMQVGGLTHPDRWIRWSETVTTIWRAGGTRGFYVGLSIGYLKIIPMTAVSFAVWQWLKRVLED